MVWFPVAFLGKKGEPCAIGRMARFVTDYERNTGQVKIPEIKPDTPPEQLQYLEGLDSGGFSVSDFRVPLMKAGLDPVRPDLVAADQAGAGIAFDVDPAAGLFFHQLGPALAGNAPRERLSDHRRELVLRFVVRSLNRLRSKPCHTQCENHALHGRPP